jgi:serine O-acetyltransferase
MFGLYKTIISELSPAKRTFIGIILNCLFNHPFKIMINIRMGQRFRKSKNPILRLYSRFLKNKQMYKWSCDISYNAKIGKGVIFGHPVGIVIGNNAIIENNVRIWQNVTLGSHGKDKHDKDYPTIKQGAKIFAGAIIIGNVTVGKNAIVAANAVVNIDVPEDCIAVGIPCKILKKKIKE